jgi:hypothetical protein
VGAFHKQIKEVPETRYRSANSSTNRSLRSGTDRGGRSNSVHSSSTGNRICAIFTLNLIIWPNIYSDPIIILFQKIDNMTSRPPVSGSCTASVNSNQMQTIAR